METRVIMQNSHNENIMEKVHKHMSAPTKCGNKDAEHLLHSNSVVGQSRQLRDNRCILWKNNCFSFLQPSDLQLLGGLWIAAQTQLGWDHYVAFIYHSLVEGRQPFGYITQHNKQTIFAQKGCDHPVATKHKFFLRKAWYD